MSLSEYSSREHREPGVEGGTTEVAVPRRHDQFPITEDERRGEVHGIAATESVPFGDVACKRRQAGAKLEEIDALGNLFEATAYAAPDATAEATCPPRGCQSRPTLDIQQSRAADRRCALDHFLDRLGSRLPK
jgi:hypothetical protein